MVDFLFLPGFSAMTRYLPPVLMVAGFALAFGACFLGDRGSEPPPVACSCRQLHDNPAAYAGRRVRVSTRGAEVSGGRLVWRPTSASDPAVAFDFAAGKIPDPLPTELVGDCHAPLRGGPVRVVDCRPAD